MVPAFSLLLGPIALVQQQTMTPTTLIFTDFRGKILKIHKKI